MKKLSFNIIGAGAMGHLWASFLSRAGFSVKFYARTQREKTEFNIQSPLGHFTQSIQYSILSDWQDADVTLICVKAYQLEALCLELSEIKIASNQFILMMNGMGLIEIVGQYLPQIKLFHASIIHGVYIQDNQIIHTGNGKTLLGYINSDHLKPDQINSNNKHSNFSHKNVRHLIEQLNQTLPEVCWNENHHQTMHIKLIINAIINPITALNNQANQSVLVNRKLSPESECLLLELKPLLKILLPEYSYQSIKQEIELVAYNTRNNISSMLQDIKANKITEIDFINGYLIELANSRQVNLNEHIKIVHKIKQLTRNL